MISNVTVHFKKWFLSGILVILPLFITVVVIRFLFGIIAGLLLPVLQQFFPAVPMWAKSLVLLAVLVFLIYLLGLTTGHFLGHWFLTRFEKLLLRIPLLRTIYGSTREVVRIFMNPDRKSAFKEVVMLEFPGPGLYAFGFITGSVIDPQGRPSYLIFIPTTPNPTNGYLEVIEQSRVLRCNLTVEEGIKTIMSGGILSPETLAVPHSSTNPEHPLPEKRS